MATTKLFNGYRNDPNLHLSVTITTRWIAPTPITHMVLFSYPSEISLRSSARPTRWMKQQQPQI